jgi:hypothetical protein
MLPMNKADYYGSMAEECRLMAERAINSQDKEKWLKLARDWLSLNEPPDEVSSGVDIVEREHERIRPMKRSNVLAGKHPGGAG